MKGCARWLSDPNVGKVKAREQYEKDKALREEVIRNRSKNNSNR